MPNNNLKKEKRIFDNLATADKSTLEEKLWAFNALLGKALEWGHNDEAVKLIRKANGIVPDEEKTVTEQTREWILVSTGSFTVSEICRALGFVRKEDAKERNTIRQEVHRLKKVGIIESFGERNDVYRIIHRELKKMDYINAPTTPLPLKWPLFDANSPIFDIYGSNTCIVSGGWQAGKSAYLIEFSKQNMYKFKVDFYSSEMGDSEFKIRLMQHDDIRLEEWKINAFEKSDFFHDVIDPNAISVIDYIETGESAYEVNKILKQLDRKLKDKKGICVCGLQKPAGRDLGYGKDYSAWVPRLYLSIDSGIIKIVKAKNWHGHNNPNNMARDFKLIKGAKFLPISGWYLDEKKLDKY